MPNDERMTIDERYKYLRIRQEQYHKASRQERSELLDHMQQTTGLNRKTLIRHMKRKQIVRKSRRRQRGKTYGAEVDHALWVISESLDHICAERLTPHLSSMAQHLAAHGELQVTVDLLEKLGQVSVSTVGRRLKQLRRLQRWHLPRRQGPRSSNPVTRSIPMKRIPWDEHRPGHFEVDLVHHCGPTSSGHYVHTMQMIDVATGWSERVAVLGRSQLVMEDAFCRIFTRLPFPILEIHPDNGSEFFNWHLVRLWRDTIKGVKLSRSRPFHKNDNRFVEQKNATLVRAYLGDRRFDTVAQTHLLNRLYDKMWVYYNFFQPVMRLQEKTTFCRNGEAHSVRRRYDAAQTPFQRLCATDAISDQQRRRMKELRDQTNPRHLRREIYHLLDHLFSLPHAQPDHLQDVRQTLFIPQVA